MLHLLWQSPQRAPPSALPFTGKTRRKSPPAPRERHSTSVQCSIHGVQRSRELNFCQGVPNTKRKRPRDECDEWATEAQARIGRNQAIADLRFLDCRMSVGANCSSFFYDVFKFVPSSYIAPSISRSSMVSTWACARSSRRMAPASTTTED